MQSFCHGEPVANCRQSAPQAARIMSLARGSHKADLKILVAHSSLFRRLVKLVKLAAKLIESMRFYRRTNLPHQVLKIIQIMDRIQPCAEDFATFIQVPEIRT